MYQSEIDLIKPENLEKLKKCKFCKKIQPRHQMSRKQGALSCNECNDWAERVCKIMGVKD